MLVIEWPSCPWFRVRRLQASFNIFYVQITLRFICLSLVSFYLFSYIFINTFDIIILDDKKASQTYQVHNQIYIIRILILFPYATPSSGNALYLLLPRNQSSGSLKAPFSPRVRFLPPIIPQTRRYLLGRSPQRRKEGIYWELNTYAAREGSAGIQNREEVVLLSF